MAPDPSPGELRAFISEILLGVAGYVTERFGTTGPLTFKYGREAITEVDSEVEDLLTARILAVFPGHRVHGEERGEGGGDGTPWVWYIDPIDGTLNYSLEIPSFSSTVAVMHGDRIIAGGVLDPLRDELFTAAAGGGAFVGDRRLRVSDRSHLADAIVSTQFSRKAVFVRHGALLSAIMTRSLKIRRLGTIALELAYVAAGRFDLLLAGKSVPQNLYDVAAGVLLVEEAGGRVSGRDGSPFTPRCTELIASNGRVHDEAIAMIEETTGGAP